MTWSWPNGASRMTNDVIAVRRCSAVRWDVVLDDDRRRNALSASLVAQLRQVLAAAERAETRIVVLRSSGRVFCSGLDVSDLDRETDATMSTRLAQIGLLLDSLRRAPFLTVAVTEGPAVGAGADLALACDLRIGTEDTTFRFPGLGFGLVLGTARLAGLLGEDRSLDLLLGNGVLDSRSAQLSGVLNLVADHDAAEAVLGRYEATIGDLPSGALGQVLAATRSTRAESDGIAELLRSTADAPGLVERIAHYRKETKSAAPR